MKRKKHSKDQSTEELNALHTRLAESERVQTEHQRKDEQLKHSLDEARHRREEVAALLDGSRAVLQYRDFQEAARIIFESCKKLMGATAGYVALLTKDGSENEVLFLDSGGLPCSVDPSLPMPIRGLRAEAYRTRTVVYDNDFANSKRVKFMPEGHVALDNVMFAPLVIEGEAHGLLGLANKPGGFTENDARIAGAFGELAAISLLNSRTLQSLENSEEMLRSVVETATDAIVTGDSDGNVVFWNESAERIFGYPADAILGRPVADLMPERFREAHREGLRRIQSTGETRLIGKTVEMTGLRRDGNEFPVELSLATWRTGEGVFFTALLRDVTQRKRVEEALNRERNNLVNILDSMEDGVYVVNQTYDIQYANPALVREFGTFEGRKCYEYFHDREDSCPWCKNQDVFAGKMVRWQWTSPKNQKTYDLVDTLMHNPDGSVSKLEIFRDITQLQQAQAEMEKAAQFLLENPHPMLRIGNEGTVLYANPTGASLLSESARLIGQPAPELMAQAARKVLDSGVRDTLEIAHGKKTFSFTVAPVRDAGYVNLYGRDVTERKRAEQELRRHEQHLEELVKERTAELERSHQELRELAAHVQTAREEERTSVAREIHDELGQVLTGLHMGLSWLDTRLAELEDEESRAVLLGKISSMSLLVDRTIESVQRIAAELRPGVLDDFGLVAAIESHARKFQEQTGIRCNVVLAPGSTEFDDATSTALFRIVQETLTNVARHANATNVAITFKNEGNNIALVVKDDGRGIQGSEISRSASLGLLGMRERAAALGGQFQITSVPGKGTTVKVVLPVAGALEGQENIDFVSGTDPQGGSV